MSNIAAAALLLASPPQATPADALTASLERIHAHGLATYRGGRSAAGSLLMLRCALVIAQKAGMMTGLNMGRYRLSEASNTCHETVTAALDRLAADGILRRFIGPLEKGNARRYDLLLPETTERAPLDFGRGWGHNAFVTAGLGHNGQRIYVTLSPFKSMTVSEIADGLGLSITTVKSLMKGLLAYGLATPAPLRGQAPTYLSTGYANDEKLDAIAHHLTVEMTREARHKRNGALRKAYETWDIHSNHHPRVSGVERFRFALANPAAATMFYHPDRKCGDPRCSRGPLCETTFRHPNEKCGVSQCPLNCSISFPVSGVAELT